jgi:hypothetical protein
LKHRPPEKVHEVSTVNSMVNKLTERKGEIALHGALILLGSVLLLLLALEIYHAYNTITYIKDSTSQALLAVASLNVSNVYDGVRESDWDSRQYTDNSWKTNVDTSQLINQLASSTGATQTGTDSLLKENSYQILHLSTTYTNDDGGLTFTTTGTLEIFFRIGDVINISIPYNIDVVTAYATKF